MYYATKKQLTGSKIVKYLKDHNYLYRRYITEEIKDKFTPALLIGSAVDCWLTESKEIFNNKCICVSRRNLKNPPQGVIELNNSQYNEVVEMCEAVERTTAYKDLSDYHAQEMIKIPMDLGEHFDSLVGKPDWYVIRGNNCIIVDLKTAQSIEGMKHHWDCISYGYYFKQAVYQYILKQLHPEITRFVSRHLVVGKEDGINPVKTYLLNQETINIEKIKLLNTLKEIKERKDWSKKDSTWEDEEEI